MDVRCEVIRLKVVKCCEHIAKIGKKIDNQLFSLNIFNYNSIFVTVMLSLFRNFPYSIAFGAGV